MMASRVRRRPDDFPDGSEHSRCNASSCAGRWTDGRACMNTSLPRAIRQKSLSCSTVRGAPTLPWTSFEMIHVVNEIDEDRPASACLLSGVFDVPTYARLDIVSMTHKADSD